MNPSEAKVQSLFEDARRLPAEGRAQLLIEQCADNPQLRARVEELLRIHDGLDPLPDPQAAQTLDANPSASFPRPALPTAPDEPPGTMIGHYKLLQQIGEGGFGVVYMAEQEQPVKRRVALKVIKPGMDTQAVIARFEAERQALAMMDHPNIARVLDAGATGNGRPYFVMELVKGIPITEYCDQSNFTMRERLALFVDVCRAVQHAHQKGIIHRDLKPSNIMITLHDGKPVVKVIDFGIAKATDQKLTEKTLFTSYGQMIGTPVYMSPEQAFLSGLDVDTRSDIYSLGILLYEMLTGSPPFDAKTLRSAGFDEMRRIIREQQPPKPSTRLSTMEDARKAAVSARRQASPQVLSRQLHGDLDWIVLKAIEKERSRRYESASAFAQDVERYLNCEPVAAAAPTALYTLKKFTQRNKGPMAAATAIILLFFAGTTVSIWQAVRATHAEKNALTEASRATRAEALANARLVEVAAQRDAKEEARKHAQAISDFLAGVFQSPDPARDGRTITVAETLDNALQKLNADSAIQPEERARLQWTIGNTYFALHLHQKAIPAQKNALTFYRSTFGPNDENTLGSMNALAISYGGANLHDQAIALQEDVLRIRRTLVGPDHPDTLVATTNLAAVYANAGRLVDALKLQERVLPLCRKLRGDEHPETLLAMGNLADSYQSSGRVDEAINLLEQALPLSRKAMGPAHPETLRVMWNLTRAYRAASRWDDALPISEQTLDLTRKLDGPDSPRALSAMNNLANSYSGAGQSEKALKMREEVLALRLKVNGPEDPDTLAAMTNLAKSLGQAGRLPEAITLQEKSLALKRRIIPKNHPYFAVALTNMADLYEQANRNEEAAKIRDELEKLDAKK